MDAERLAAVGHLLHGSRWKTALARNLGVTGRTVRRWASGATPIPSSAADKLSSLLEKRLRELEAITYFPPDFHPGA